MSVFHNVPRVPREKMERWNAFVAARLGIFKCFRFLSFDLNKLKTIFNAQKSISGQLLFIFVNLN